jgi:hypothetical protein
VSVVHMNKSNQIKKIAFRSEIGERLALTPFVFLNVEPQIGTNLDESSLCKVSCLACVDWASRKMPSTATHKIKSIMTPMSLTH